MSSGSLSPVVGPVRGYRWALVLPFVWQAGGAPLVNDIRLAPFGLPFPMVWQMAGIVLTSAVIAYVFRRDRDNGLEDEEAAFLKATTEPVLPRR